ncbi:MAG: 30S ribosome-binding factor RbfA [Planctomycetota bacterium]|jgi:ribosome-binding factor A
MADPRRVRRLEQAILQTVAPLISHGLADPRLSMITVTRIRLSPDLTVARVNWSCLGDDADRSKAEHALERARGLLQAAVAKNLRTRTTPRLTFHFDTSLEKAQRVSGILDQLARERGDNEEQPEDAEGREPASDEDPEAG